MATYTLPAPLTHRAGILATAALLSTATLLAALLPTLTQAAPTAPHIVNLPRVVITGVHVADGTVWDLPRVVVVAHRVPMDRTPTDTQSALKKAVLRA